MNNNLKNISIVFCCTLFCMLFLLTGCNSSYDTTNNLQIENLSIFETYDTTGRLISKEVYNRETKITIVYQYYYEEENGCIFCKDIDVLKIDKEENIINIEEKRKRDK